MMPERVHVITWKLMVGGTGSVGKTTIINRFVTGMFSADIGMTIGVQFHVKEMHRHGKGIKLALWDLGGQDRFQFMLPSYCTGAHAAIVLFAMDDLETLQETKRWVDLFRSKLPPNAPILLVGTKLDRVDPGQWNEIEKLAVDFCTRHGFDAYVPTSSKTGHNVEHAFEFIVDHLVKTL